MKKTTDPGVAPLSSPPAGLELVDPGAVTAPTPPPVAPIASAAAAPGAAVPLPAHLLDTSPELPPLATRFGGDPTPVPETTDGLLNGLIANENEAYFRRAKAASASSGEAAAAFHGDPRPVAAGSPTPPPEPPVLLRQSVEMDIEKASTIGARRLHRSEVTTEPNPIDPPVAVRGALEERLPDPTIELPEPRPAWVQKALAFGIAVLAVGAVGLLLLRWLSNDDVKETAPAAPSAAPVVQTAALPPEPGPAIPPPPPASSPEPTAEARTPTKNSVRASPGAPGSRTTPRTSRSVEGPQEVVPPPKDDVKRSM